jgi:tetratricopeptide (TPR) repeat protein
VLTHTSPFAAAAPRRLSLTRAVVAAGLLAASVVVGGCAEMTSTSGRSRREGMYQYENKQYPEAAGAFANAVRKNPRDYKSHYHLGNSYVEMGQFQQAVHAYKASLDTQYTTLAGREDVDQRPATLSALANAIARSDTRDVELNLVEQNARNGQSAENYFLLAKIYRNRGDADLAVDAYNRASLIEPKNFHIQKDYGLYLEQLGQAQQAEAALRKAYVLRESDTEVNTALRRIGVIPGPGLKDQRELASPPMPKGPIPPMQDWGKKPTARTTTPGAPAPSVQPIAPSVLPAQTQTVQAPRD